MDLCANLEVKRPTAQNFIELLEATHLIIASPRSATGRTCSARFKIYLADAAIAPAVMPGRARPSSEDASALGVATETAVFGHLFARYYAQNVRFQLLAWQTRPRVDLVAEVGGELIPSRVKYRAQHTGARELKGLIWSNCANRNASSAVIVVTVAR